MLYFLYEKKKHQTYMISRLKTNHHFYNESFLMISSALYTEYIAIDTIKSCYFKEQSPIGLRLSKQRNKQKWKEKQILFYQEVFLNLDSIYISFK